MNIQQIEAFLLVCKAGSFTNAANRLYITQPTLNYRIHSLEDELGARLFNSRKGVQGIELTQAGEAFIPQANKLLRVWNETLNSVKNPYTETFTVAMSQSIMRPLGSEICGEFLKHEYSVSLSLDSYSRMQTLSSVKDGSLDVAVLSSSYSYSGVKILPIAKEKMVVMCSKDSPYGDYVKRGELDFSKELLFEWSGEFILWNNYIKAKKENHLVNTNTIIALESFIRQPGIWAYTPVSLARMMQRLYGTRICATDIEPPDRTMYFIQSLTPKQPYTDVFLNDVKRVFAAVDGITVID